MSDVERMREAIKEACDTNASIEDVAGFLHVSVMPRPVARAICEKGWVTPDAVHALEAARTMAAYNLTADEMDTLLELCEGLRTLLAVAGLDLARTPEEAGDGT